MRRYIGADMASQNSVSKKLMVVKIKRAKRSRLATIIFTDMILTGHIRTYIIINVKMQVHFFLFNSTFT